MIKTNDIRKGWRVQQYNGWFGTMMDNRKGNIRSVLVEGIYTEQGDIYAHQIRRAQDPATGQWHAIEFTNSQLSLMAAGW